MYLHYGMDNYAYITVLTNMKYYPGVIALSRGLKAVNSKYPLYVLLPEEKTDIQRKLADNGILSLLSSGVELPDNYKDCHWRDTFLKLKAVGLTQFKKVILIDSDMLVNKNLDHLFNKPANSAVVSGKTKNPDYTLLNSGLMVIETSRDYLDVLIKSIPFVIDQKNKSGKNSGDQDVFQYVLNDWDKHLELELPEEYNCFWYDIEEVCKAKKITYKDVYIVHFIGSEKPWMWSIGKRFVLYVKMTLKRRRNKSATLTRYYKLLKN